MPKIQSTESAYDAARKQAENDLIDFIIERVSRQAKDFTNTKVSANPEA